MPRRKPAAANSIEVDPLLQQAEQYAHSVSEPEKRAALLCSRAIWRLRAGDIEGAEQALAQVQETVSAAEYESSANRCLAHCAVRLALEGEIERGARLVAKLLASDSGGGWAGSIAARVFRAGKPAYARAFIQHWLERRAPIAPQEFAQAIHSAASEGAIAFALELLERAPTGADLSLPLKEIAERLTSRRRFEEALALAERIPLAHWRLDALNTIAEQALKHGQEAIARQAMQQAHTLIPEARLSAQRDPMGSLWRFVQVGRLLLELGDADAARQIAHQLPASQAFYLFEPLIRFYVSQNDFETAQQVAAESPLAHLKNYAQTCIAHQLARLGREAEAMEIIERLPNVFLREREISQIVALYAQQGRIEEAQALISQMQTFIRNDALYRVALALANARQYELALQLSRACAELQNDAFLKIVDAMIEHIPVEDALQLLQAHCDHRAYERGLLKLFKACLKQGDSARAEAILAQMQSDGQRAQALATLARHQLQHGEWQAALQTAEQIPKPNPRDRLIAQIARRRAQAGDWENAKRVAQRILAPALLSETLYWIAEQTRP